MVGHTSAQREDGLLQPEAAQQNRWALSSAPSSLGKQRGMRKKAEKCKKADGQQREKKQHWTQAARWAQKKESGAIGK